jgi:iron complex transport system substrate-binding protein
LVVTAVVAALGVIVVGFLALRKPASLSKENPRYPVTLTDDTGVSHTITSPPKRVVTVGPHLTEILFEIGAGDLIVGVAAGETYPPEATAISEIVGADGLTPDPAKIVSLTPDLVVASGTAEEWKTAVEAGGIKVISFEATNVRDAIEDIRNIGKVVAHPAAAKRLADRMDGELGAANLAKDAPRPTVFFETFAEPIRGTAPQSFIGDLVSIAGGRAVPESQDQYPALTIDQLRELQPQIYIALASTGVSVEEVKKRRRFAELEAVKSNRVFIIEDDLILRPGPRLGLGLEKLQKMIRGDGPPLPGAPPSG